MQVFHYLADQLKDTPLFESSIQEQLEGEKVGSIYNDFDCESPYPETSTPIIEPSQEVTNREEEIISQRELDFALLEADREENAFNVFIDSENFDTTSTVADEQYHEKVLDKYSIACIYKNKKVLSFFHS